MRNELVRALHAPRGSRDYNAPGYHEAQAADLEEKAQAAPTPELCADLYRQAAQAWLDARSVSIGHGRRDQYERAAERCAELAGDLPQGETRV